jgi:DNA mismatch repair protein MutS
MEIDQISYNDLAIFKAGEDHASIFEKLNFTRTNGGRHQLEALFNNPLTTLEQITTTQNIVQCIQHRMEQWPAIISNGTIMVMEKFFGTAVDTIPPHANAFSARMYQLLHNNDFSLIRFSITHFADFFRGLQQMLQLLLTPDAPPLLQVKLKRVEQLMHNHAILQELVRLPAGQKPGAATTLRFAYFFKERYKNTCFELIDTYSLLDAWYSMAKAGQVLQLAFPQFIDSKLPLLEVQKLYHPLLETPVAYDVELKQGHNFLFLTGANMAGKSTYIKAVGTGVFLAHLGMGVPALGMRLSLFDGLLSNIQIADNIIKGESYFFNEVQRVRNTVEKINTGKKWLVLIDELFKGTNVEDAMKCSTTVIKGLLRIEHSLFILSTHLYEIGEDLKPYPNIIFRYFETFAKEDVLEFSYVLKEGISNDRLGYLILKREGVVDLLERL